MADIKLDADRNIAKRPAMRARSSKPGRVTNVTEALKSTAACVYREERKHIH